MKGDGVDKRYAVERDTLATDGQVREGQRQPAKKMHRQRWVCSVYRIEARVVARHVKGEWKAI